MTELIGMLILTGIVLTCLIIVAHFYSTSEMYTPQYDEDDDDDSVKLSGLSATDLMNPYDVRNPLNAMPDNPLNPFDNPNVPFQ